MKEVQTKTQERLTTPSPQISYLCLLSQSQGEDMPQARAGHKSCAKSTHSVTNRVRRIIQHVLHKKKQLSSGDNLLPSLYCE